jgi:hypothetical protein
VSIDLAGGLAGEHKLFFGECPVNLQMRDSANFRVCDNRGHMDLPRIGIEAIAAAGRPSKFRSCIAKDAGTAPGQRVIRVGWRRSLRHDRAC